MTLIRPGRSVAALVAGLAAGLLLVAPGTAHASARGGRILRVGPGGEFTSVQAAIDAVRPGSGPATIVIAPGTYPGQVYVPPDKPDLTLAGATGRAGDVVLTDDIAHGTVAPNGNQYGTDCSATVSVAGNDFSAYGITFENAFDPRRTRRSPRPRRWRSRPWPTV